MHLDWEVTRKCLQLNAYTWKNENKNENITNTSLKAWYSHAIQMISKKITDTFPTWLAIKKNLPLNKAYVEHLQNEFLTKKLQDGSCVKVPVRCKMNI